jgi:hypothetical protein
MVFLVCSAQAMSTARAFIRILSVTTDFGPYTPEIGRFLHTESTSITTWVMLAALSETVLEARTPGAHYSYRIIASAASTCKGYLDHYRSEIVDAILMAYLQSSDDEIARIRELLKQYRIENNQ